MKLVRLVSALVLSLFALGAAAQAPYGAPISLENAKKAAAATAAEARKNGWFMGIAVVDPSGDLIYFERMDNKIGRASCRERVYVLV